MNQYKNIAVTLLALFALSACGSSTDESEQTYDAESYEYKGAADPLLSVSAAERAGPLGDRFDLVQGRK